MTIKEQTISSFETNLSASNQTWFLFYSRFISIQFNSMIYENLMLFIDGDTKIDCCCLPNRSTPTTAYDTIDDVMMIIDRPNRKKIRINLNDKKKKKKKKIYQSINM